MRDSVSHLPDYTCRITLERFARPNGRLPFELNDRIRLEVAYTGGQELYSWPGNDRFEAGIEDLLPGHGMVSNGAYALHIRNLFVRDIAEFSGPRQETCDSRPCLRLDFEIPAARSGYSVSAGAGAATVPLTGSAWFDPATLDIVRLEVRVDQTPRSVRIAATREITNYARVHIGEVDAVLPSSSELLLRDRNGSEARNYSTFDRYRRYTGSATIFYGAGAEPEKPATPQPATAPTPTKNQTMTLDSALPIDAAIGDPVTLTARDGAHYSARIVNLRHAGKRWMVVLAMPGLLRTGLQLPLPAGHTVDFRRERN